MDMKQPSYGICVSVQELPKFHPKNPDNLYLEIARYLDEFMEKSSQATAHRVFNIPSIEDLSRFFRCSQAEILHAVLRLGNMGYSREMRGTRQPLKLWRQAMRPKEKQPLEVG